MTGGSAPLDDLDKMNKEFQDLKKSAGQGDQRDGDRFRDSQSQQDDRYPEPPRRPGDPDPLRRPTDPDPLRRPGDTDPLRRPDDPYRHVSDW